MPDGTHQTRATPDGTAAPSLDLARLRFRDRHVERRYQVEQMERSRPFVRVTLALGAALYALFGLLDWMVVAPDNLTDVWLIRFGAVTPILVAAFASTWFNAFLQHTQAILVATLLAPGFGVLGMTVVTDPPVSHTYYAGLIMCVIYCSALIRLHPLTTLTANLILFVSYMAALCVASTTPAWICLTHLFFLGMSCGVGVFTSYGVEWLVRDRFVKNELLARQAERAHELQLRAEKANAAKTDFLATMSHELRTPLNAVIGFSEVIRDEMFGPVGAPAYKEYAGNIHDSGRHLLDIVNDILDITKAENGSIDLAEDEVDLSALIERVATMARGAAAAKGLTIVSDPPPETRVVADPRLLRQATLNLAVNAAKFTNEGEIRISATENAEAGLDIAVSDTGIGIDEADQTRIFEPFTQIEGAYSRNNGGVGLGLALVRKIADLHDARISVESTPGQGSTFTISLPPERITARPSPDDQMASAGT